jgi:hypothetical protein
MAHDVFISYSSRDKNTADAVCAALERNRIRCWIASRDVMPGKEWGEEIVQAISNSQIMVLVFSSAANRSQQVLREVERAVNKNVIIVPFRIEDVLPTRSMEYFLYSTHWLDALTPDLEKHIGRLVDTVGKLLASPEQHVAAVPPMMGRPKPPYHRLKERIRQVSIGVLVLLALFGIAKIFNIQVQFKPRQTQTHSGTTSSGSLIGSGDQRLRETRESGRLNGSDANQPRYDHDLSTNDGITGSKSDLNDHKQTTLKIGDYVNFGRYDGEPVEWRVININRYGNPLLLSAKIISIKPFDAAEGGIYNQRSTGRKIDDFMAFSELIARFPMDELRLMKGNNSWGASNLREWLNSRDKQVKYSSTPPSSEAIVKEGSAYDREPGFLSNFNANEENLIQPVTHPSLLSLLEKGRNDGGNHLYAFKRGKSAQAIAGYENAYFRAITDKVFLLSTQELYEDIVNRGWDLGVVPTQKVKERYGVSKYNTWWLMTPEANTSFRVFLVDGESDFIDHFNAAAPMGIRPALYLRTVKLALSGSGTEADPYRIR